MSEDRTRPGGAAACALSDHALIDALSEAARAVAAETSDPLRATPVHWRGGALLNGGRAGPAARWHQRRWRLTLVAAVAGVAAAALLVVPRWVRDESLTFEVRGNAVESGGYVRAVADAPGPATGQVRFSDGTEIELLDTESRLSVVAPGPRGSRLRLDTGRAQFRVRHLPRADWSVEAGPYVVHVTGTVFDVRWSSRDELCEVSLHAGSVRVTGPGLSDAVPLRAGQRLTARPARGQVTIEKIERPTGVERPPDPASRVAPALTPNSTAAPSPTGDSGEDRTPPAPPPRSRPPTDGSGPRMTGSHARGLAWLEARPDGNAAASTAMPGRDAVGVAPAAVPPSVPATEPPPLVPGPAGPVEQGNGPAARVEAPLAGTPAPASPAWTHRRWSESVAVGDTMAVLAEAEQVGIGVALESADRANLAALADAARYQRRPELAARVLAQQRARFPGTRDAARAAFLLGRLADDRGDGEESTRWYGRYLAEAPRGAFADEALGRLMLAIQRRQGRRGAGPLATDYLRRFPNGTYLFQARAILSGR